MALRAVTHHPKFADLKMRLGLSKAMTLGCLEALWHFTGEFAPQGNVGKYTDGAIERWIEWDGEAGALMGAMTEVGWLDASDEHRLVVHDWAEWADELVHTWLARRCLKFADGTIPSGRRLFPREREIYRAWLKDIGAEEPKRGRPPLNEMTAERRGNDVEKTLEMTTERRGNDGEMTGEMTAERRVNDGGKTGKRRAWRDKPEPEPEPEPEYPPTPHAVGGGGQPLLNTLLKVNSTALAVVAQNGALDRPQACRGNGRLRARSQAAELAAEVLDKASIPSGMLLGRMMAKAIGMLARTEDVDDEEAARRMLTRLLEAQAEGEQRWLDWVENGGWKQPDWPEPT